MPHECTNCGRTFDDGSKEMLSGCPNCGGNKFQFRPAGGADRSAGTPDESDSDGPSSAAESDDAPSSADPSPGAAESDAAARNPDPDADTADTADRARTEWPSPDDPAGTADRPGPTDPASADDPTPADDPGPAASPAETEGSAGAAEPPSPDTSDPTDSEGSPPDAPDAPDAAGTDDPADAHEDTAQASARSDVVTAAELEGAATPPATDPEAAEPDPEPDVEALREELNEQFESIRILNPGQYELNLMELYDRQEYIISLREDGRYVIEMPEDWGPHDDG